MTTEFFCNNASKGMAVAGGWNLSILNCIHMEIIFAKKKCEQKTIKSRKAETLKGSPSVIYAWVKFIKVIKS